MSTTGTYTFTVTRNTVIRNAMLNIGKIGDTEVPTINEITDCSVFLNMLIKQRQGRQDFANGIKMWTRARGDLVLSTQKGSYVLSTSGDNWMGGVTTSLSSDWPNYNLSLTSGASPASINTLSLGLNTYTGQSANSITGFTVGDFVVVQLGNGDIFSSTCQSLNLVSGTVTLAANLPSAVNAGAMVWNYTVKQQPPLEIQTCILRDSQQNDTPINYMTLEIYEALPTKVQPSYISDPTSIYYEPQLTNGALRSGVLYLDVSGAQDVTKILHIVGLRPVQDCLNPNDNVDFPQEHLLFLSLELSKLITPMFNAQWTQEMEDNRKKAESIAMETTPEVSRIYFQCGADEAF